MKKYYYNVYISGWKKIEVVADTEEEAYNKAEEIMKRITNVHLLDESAVEAEYNYEEEVKE